MTRWRIALFSFTLAIPTILGAGTFEIWNIREIAPAPIIFPALVVGTAVAFFVARLTMKYFLTFLETKQSLTYLGLYRIIFGLSIILFFM